MYFLEQNVNLQTTKKLRIEHKYHFYFGTPSYMDTQGGGPTVTMSMAILNAMENGSSLLGVAGIDVPFKHFAEILPENEQMYAFIVDNNGIAIYHPQLKIPVSYFRNNKQFL